LDLDTAHREGRYAEILGFLLRSEGLDYGNLPKGLIPFHKYPEGCRTPFAEHLVEASTYALDATGVGRVHFTAPAQHLGRVQVHLQQIQAALRQRGITVEVSLSTQKPSTATIGVDACNEPVRTEEDQLVFRPAGHGALLTNLCDLQGDIVFIKNIDNVVPERLTAETRLYKRLLGGLLVSLQDRIFAYLRILATGQVDPAVLAEIAGFARQRLNLAVPDAIAAGTTEEQTAHWFTHLNRPLRVCGMVRNEGEAGGGPFWVRRGSDISVQIVEKAQIDLRSPDQQEAFARSTHFNPVDIVCGVRDYQGKPFDLHAFVDRETGFITMKSKNGVALKSMELPGLWNGSMAHWNTVFVEVPRGTFNPVKTVQDLLRPEHQA
jgi:hypothetical protein